MNFLPLINLNMDIYLNTFSIIFSLAKLIVLIDLWDYMFNLPLFSKINLNIAQ